MKCFDVWVRPMDYQYQVTVDGAENADWLLTQLSRSFIFKSSAPIQSSGSNGQCSFQVPYGSLLPFSLFRKLLAQIPEVTLFMQPAMA